MSAIANNLDDSGLWAGVQCGNLSAFEVLYNRFFKSLYNYGRKVCNDTTTVEDAIHDLFLDIWRYRQNLSSTTSVKFYLYCALRRRIIKNKTKDTEASIFDFHLNEFQVKKIFSHEDNIIEVERSDERISKLKKDLTNLSPRQYESVILRFYEEFSYEEIASILNVNEQSARNLVQRGLEHLRSYAKPTTAKTAS
jgi:RNA polymerase sigma factor (sigma-70 family)